METLLLYVRIMSQHALIAPAAASGGAAAAGLLGARIADEP
jgi:hypothetical protein